MLLYLTSNEKVNLLDAVATDQKMKKLVGRFSFNQFVIKDMRNFSICKFLVVDMDALEEKMPDFIKAVQSYRMMYDARIIVILSGNENAENYIPQLLSERITNIVIGDNADQVRKEIEECLSAEGMTKYLPKQYEDENEETEAVEPLERAKLKVTPKYEWSCKNKVIAIGGVSKRCGVTMTAMNLVTWLVARGATACYLDDSRKQQFIHLLNVISMEKKGEGYTLEGVDYYATDEILGNYNFIVVDCGELDIIPLRFQEADIRILCGGLQPYEVSAYYNMVKKLKSRLEFIKVGTYIMDGFEEYSKEVLGDELIFAETSNDLFAIDKNEQIYYPILKEYMGSKISEEKNGLWKGILGAESSLLKVKRTL